MQPDFEKQEGLVPVVVQDVDTKDVLMLAYMNKEAWDKTIETKRAHFYSRSRKKLWQKGEESGHVQLVREIRLDCDNDTVLLMVEQIGKAACHTGYRSCFYKRIIKKDGDITTEICGEKIFDPKEVYK